MLMENSEVRTNRQGIEVESLPIKLREFALWEEGPAYRTGILGAYSPVARLATGRQRNYPKLVKW